MDGWVVGYCITCASLRHQRQGDVSKLSGSALACQSIGHGFNPRGWAAYTGNSVHQLFHHMLSGMNHTWLTIFVKKALCKSRLSQHLDFCFKQKCIVMFLTIHVTAYRSSRALKLQTKVMAKPWISTVPPTQRCRWQSVEGNSWPTQILMATAVLGLSLLRMTTFIMEIWWPKLSAVWSWHSLVKGQVFKGA